MLHRCGGWCCSNGFHAGNCWGRRWKWENKQIYSLRAFLMAQWVKNPPARKGHRRRSFSSWVGKIPWRRKWQPTPVFLPGQPHGQRSLVGYSPWGHKELDTTEQLTHTHTQQYWVQTISRSRRPSRSHKQILKSSIFLPSSTWELFSLPHTWGNT